MECSSTSSTKSITPSSRRFTLTHVSALNNLKSPQKPVLTHPQAVLDLLDRESHLYLQMQKERNHYRDQAHQLMEALEHMLNVFSDIDWEDDEVLHEIKSDVLAMAQKTLNQAKGSL